MQEGEIDGAGYPVLILWTNAPVSGWKCHPSGDMWVPRRLFCTQGRLQCLGCDGSAPGEKLESFGLLILKASPGQ